MSFSYGEYNQNQNQPQSQYDQRLEFIERFQIEHNQIPNNQISNQKETGRWSYLHNLNRVKQMKLEEQRKKQKEKEEENLTAECTFSPKLNKSVSTTARNIEGISSEIESTILQRQEIWNQRKDNHIKNIRAAQKKKESEECHFKPEINKSNCLNKSHISTSAEQCVLDPESYSLYVSRLKAKRDEDAKRKRRENSMPGSGKIWTAKKRNYNMDYDYTKHEITERNLPKSKSSKKLGIESENYKEFKEYKPNNILENSQSNCSDKHINQMRNNIMKQDDDIDFIFYNKQIEYYKAVDILHNELYNISLLDN